MISDKARENAEKMWGGPLPSHVVARIEKIEDMIRDVKPNGELTSTQVMALLMVNEMENGV
jgi:hypothetical protein